MSANRIILNTVATYIRSVIAVGLALFSSRWVLAALGQSDFGLFSVVGSIIAFVTFLNAVMALSAARYFAFSIGRGDDDEVNRWFNTSLSIHLILPVILILIGWPTGEYCIRHILTIPPERVTACLWVFRISLVTAFISMVSVPYIAMFTAKQHIAEVAVWGTLQAVLLFVFAYILTQVSGDRLLFFAIYVAAVNIAIPIIQVIRARLIFRECRHNIARWFDYHRCYQLFSFAVWSLVGAFGYLIRLQGPAILLNLFFNATVNAAYGLANTVSMQTANLSSAMVGALSPEITASEGRGDRARMLDYSLRACKFSTLLIMLFAVPLAIEMDYVLKIWLRDPPAYTSVFCQLMLIVFLMDYISIGHVIAVNAGGKIAAYQAVLGILNMLTIPLAWFFLKRGYAPTSVGVAIVIMCTISSITRVLWARHQFGMSLWQWVKEVVLSCGVVAAGAVFAAGFIGWFMQPSFIRLLLAISASAAVIGALGWFIVLNSRERLFLTQNISKVIRKITGGKTVSY